MLVQHVSYLLAPFTVYPTSGTKVECISVVYQGSNCLLVPITNMTTISINEFLSDSNMMNMD